jgi:trigger factor
MTKRTIEMLLKRQLESAPKSKGSSQRPSLPAVECPDLAGIVIPLDAPSAATEDDVQAALLDWTLDLAAPKQRAAGDPLGPEDEILVDLVGYTSGQVVPMSAKSAVWLDDTADVLLPGVRKAALKHKVGDSYVVSIKFPSDYPVSPLQRMPITYAVDILGAQERIPLEIDEAEFFRLAGVQSEVELEERFARVVDAERWLDLAQEAQRLAMAEAMRRTAALDPPKEAIDEEILVHFWATEGAMLRARTVPLDQINSAMDYWLKNEELRAQIVESLKGAMVLSAIAEKHESELDRGIVDARIAQLTAASGGAKELEEALTAEPKERARLAEILVLEMGEAFLMSRAKVELSAGGEKRTLVVAELSAEAYAKAEGAQIRAKEPNP